MKKIITTTIFTLGLLQGASTAYAAFSTYNFHGDYGGTFYGDIFQQNELGGPLVAEAGALTFKLIGHADGSGNFHGEIVANTTVLGLPPFKNQEDLFNCSYKVDPKHGQVDLECSFETTPIVDVTGDLQCVILPSQFDLDDIWLQKKSHLDCVGTLDIDIAPPLANKSQVEQRFFIANVNGEIFNQN